jgi:hypothetical protein
MSGDQPSVAVRSPSVKAKKNTSEYKLKTHVFNYLGELLKCCACQYLDPDALVIHHIDHDKKNNQ